MKISNGRPAGVSNGGALANTANAIVNAGPQRSRVQLEWCRRRLRGAIPNEGNGTINVINTVVRDNTAAVPVVDGADGGGGAIVNVSTGTVNVTNSILNGNRVNGGRRDSIMVGGGVLNLSTGVVNVTQSLCRQ